jgi:hypothetical protein
MKDGAGRPVMPDSVHVTSAKKYRQEARKVRESAAEATSHDIREAYEKIAREYDYMAEFAERLMKRNPR